MDVTLVEHSQDDVHRRQSRQNQNRFIGQRLLECRRRPLKTGFYGGGKADGALRIVDYLRGLPQRNVLRQIERQGHRGILPLVVNRQRCVRRPKVSERSQRHSSPIRSAHINVLQRLGTSSKLRRNFHHHVILIELPVHDRDLPLSERVISRVVNIRRG